MVQILLGNGDGTFAEGQSLPTGNLPWDIWAVALADFNGDGKVDLAVTNEAGNTVTIFLGNGDGTFTPAPATPGTSDSPAAVVAADFNGDGKPDLAVANFESATATILLTEVTAGATASGVSPQGTGTHQVDASYPGDTNYDSSISGAIGLTASPVYLSPMSLAFGKQNVGTTSGSQPVTLSNTGATTLTLSGIVRSALRRDRQLRG